MFVKKRGQITVFIILGLLLLISTSIFYYIKYISSEPVKRAGLFPTAYEPQTLKLYVETCLGDVSQEPILQIIEQGGTLNFSPGNYVWYNQEQYNLWCYNEQNHGCINNLIFRQDIERELGKEIEKRLPGCVDLSLFENQGYTVEAGKPSITTRIGLSDVTIILNYPITLTKDDFFIDIPLYTTKISSPLGKMYILANEIVNQEIAHGFFDQDQWMIDNGASFIIRKHKPYPDTVYSIHAKQLLNNQPLIFRFALQGQDTISQLPNIELPVQQNGCCYNRYDTSCFKNAPEQSCSLKGASYDPSRSCICEAKTTFSDELCNNKPCNPCQNTYEFSRKQFTGQTRQHGESWCSYDSVVQSVTANPGLAYVGSRSYKHSCMNGQELIEECRDFREELCTESTNTTKAKSACRVNRWQDCSFCKTKGCCEDASLRDCYWSGWLDTQSKCHPNYPPGFRHWQGGGAEICNQATEFKICNALSCPNKWIDDTSIYCNFMGDCGNYRNIADDIGYGGFFNTDPLDRVRNYVYQEPGFNKNPREIGSKPFSLPLDTRNQAKIIPRFKSTIEKLPALLSAALNVIDYLLSLSISDFLNPFTPDPELRVVDYSFCNTWNAPLTNKCEECNDDPLKPCSEYRCKSLGQQCQFISNKGSGSCILPPQTDQEPPIITFHPGSLAEGLSATQTSISPGGTTIKGYDIAPKIKPYIPFTFGIETSEPSLCKLSMLPHIDYYSMAPIFFGEQSFSINHSISLRLPPGIVVPERVFSYLDIDSLKQMTGYLSDLSGTYQRYRSKYRSELAFYRTVTGIDMVSIMDNIFITFLRIIQPIVDRIPFIRELADILLTQFEENGYYLFIKCTDEAGNVNDEDFFIKFAIDTETADTIPPIFLSSEPENNSKIGVTTQFIPMTVYQNEPSDCKIDEKDLPYDLMTQEMNCVSSYYETSPQNGGSYECEITIPFDQQNITRYIRCRDNPFTITNYALTFIASENFTTAQPSPYLNLTEQNKVRISSSLLREQTKIETNTTAVDLTIHINDRQRCKYDHNASMSYEEMKETFNDCQFSTYDVEIGAFECTANVQRKQDENETIFIKCQNLIARPQNTNTKSTVLHYERSEELLSIGFFIADSKIEGQPITIAESTPELVVVPSKGITKEGITCGYNTQITPDLLTMSKVNEFLYQVQLGPLLNQDYFYYVKCNDKYGNTFDTNVSFTVRTY